MAELPENSLALLRDFHLFLEDADPFVVRAAKDVLRHAKTRGITVVMVGCRQSIPPELEREMVVIDFDLPSKAELATVLGNVAESASLPGPDGVLQESLLDAASGLTSVEAENAFALSVVESGELSPGIVAREKANEVKKNGLLEVWDTPISLEDVGGLDLLKDWLCERRGAFSERAREYGVPVPKGLLIVGLPGTGKSLTAKATASVFERPLLRLDAGRLFGSLVGQTEGNLRSAIATAEAIAPCVLWVDEIEKAFGSAAQSSGDGGTSARVFGSFLSWMQEKTSPVTTSGNVSPAACRSTKRRNGRNRLWRVPTAGRMETSPWPTTMLMTARMAAYGASWMKLRRE